MLDLNDSAFELPILEEKEQDSNGRTEVVTALLHKDLL
jgi:hypothetical protein